MMRIVVKNKTVLLVSFFLFLAAFLRLYRIADYMTFLGDEGRDVLVVYNILHGKFTLLGPTASVGGFFFGPIYYYFMTPFLWLFNYNPVGPAVMVALFGVATVWLVYRVGCEFFGKPVGIIAMGLYTISPLVIAYARSSWNPNLMPFFSLLIIYLVYKAVKNSSWKLFFIIGILFGITVQLHYLELFLHVGVVLYIAVMTYFAPKNFLTKSVAFLKKVALIIGGFLVGFSPVIAFEFRHQFTNTKSIFNFVFHSGQTGGNTHFFETVWKVFFQLFGRLLVAFPPEEQIKMYDTSLILYWQIIVVLISVGCVVIFLYQFFISRYQKEQYGKYLLLFLWLFVGIGLFGFYKKNIYVYYFEFMFPLPFLLLGNAVVSLARKGKIFVYGAAIVLLSISYVHLQGIPFRYPANRQLHQMETIAQFVADKTNGKPFNFAIITGGNSDHAYRYFFTLWGKTPVTIENFQTDPTRKSVTDQLFVVCESLPCGPLGHSVWEIAGFGRAEIAEQWDVSVVKIYKLVHYKEH